MMKRYFKQLCLGLLLVIGLIPFLSDSASAASGETEMKLICDSWEENVGDYSDQKHCWACEIFILLFVSYLTVIKSSYSQSHWKFMKP